MSREIMQQALDALAQPHPHIRTSFTDAKKYRENIDQDIAALEAELAKPEQEPVDWHHPDCAGVCLACLIELKVHEEYGQQGLDYLRQRVQTPRQEWVGLTDAHISNFAAGWSILGKSVQSVIYQAAAKLKEKNA